MAPAKQEPEDIFDGLEKPEAAGGGESTGLPEARPSGRGMRTALMILGGLAVLILLGFGGYWAYGQFFAPAPAPAPAAPAATPQVPVPPTQELPPAVEPTPIPSSPEPSSPPADVPPGAIPQPTPVTPVSPAEIDTDGDGLTDGQEAQAGTDVSVADTDGDGLTDGDEAGVRGTNPTVPDTDGDGLTDGDEVRVWNTNPSNTDTDGDTYSDGAEVQNGFNPNGPGRIPSANP